MDRFDIVRKNGTLSFSTMLDDFALLKGFTYRLTISIDGVS